MTVKEIFNLVCLYHGNKKPDQSLFEFIWYNTNPNAAYPMALDKPQLRKDPSQGQVSRNGNMKYVYRTKTLSLSGKLGLAKA